MNKTIILLALLFCTVTSAAQIMPWQIQNDPDGANRILLTDSIGEYLRVGLEDVISDSIDLDYIDFNLVGEPAWNEGRIYYDTTTHSLTIFDDISESSLQVGQETRVRVYNGNGAILTDGSAVSVSGLTPDGVIEVELAIASSKVSALNTIGIVTSDIGIGEYGWATTSGVVNDINTSAYTEGSAIYLSDQVAGAYTTVRPNSPSYEVRMGGIIEQDVATGKIYAELRIITNTHDNFNFFTGAVLQSNSVEMVSDGVSINCSLNNSETTDSLALVVNDGYLLVEDGINIDLPAAVTDSAPIEYWVYIDSDGAITYSTSGFPSAAVVFIPIARVIVPTLATAQSFGVLKCHAYTDHLRGAGGGGHLQHINSWIRKRPAQWISGLVLMQDPVEGTSTDTIDISYTSGVVSQLHNQNMPAFDSKVDPIFVANDPDADYTIIEGINTGDIPEDSEGVLIGNKYHTVVLWGVASQEAKDCQVYMNLASGSYTSQADGENDTDKHTNYNIPAMFTGTGFLISELLLKKSGSNYEVIRTIDLRGLIPSAGASGGVSGGAGITLFDELTDTPTTKVGSGEYGVRVNAAENALEYFEVLDNDAANELPKFTKLAFEPTGAKQGDFWQNTDPPDNLELYLYDKGAWVKIADRYQELELIGNVLFLNPEGNSVDLSGYTNTDDQTINISSNTLYIEDGNFVDLLPYLDNTDNQDTSNIDGLLPYVQQYGADGTGTDNQDLTLVGNVLAISNDPNTDVDLIGYLDNTDNQDTSNIDGLLTYVQQYGADGIGTDTSGTYHISIDNDTSSTNEIQDTTNIVGLLEFVQNNGDSVGKFVDGTDPLDAVYMDGNVGIGIATPTNELDVLGRMTLRDDNANTFIGNGVGNTTLTGSGNVGLGSTTLESLTTGNGNLHFGQYSGNSITTGINNVGIGYAALFTGNPSHAIAIGNSAGLSDSGSYNISMGRQAFDAHTIGDANISIGYQSLTSHQDGASNVAIGWRAGFSNLTGSSNVFLGKFSGYNELGSNKLYIDNTNTTTPLVYGDFATNELTVNGELHVTDRIGGAATKSAFFDANGQLIEGDIVSGAAWNTATGQVYVDATYVGIGTIDPIFELHMEGGNAYFDGTTFLGVGAAPVNGQVWSKVTGGMGWVDAALDDQTLTLTSSTLAISDGNTINLNVAYGGLESNFQTISTTSATTVNFSNKWGEEINTTASTTSERITVDSTAMYTVLVRGDITGYTLDEMLQLEIWVNGVQVEQHKFKAIESVFPINFTDDIEINAGEYIELKLDSVTDTDYEYNDLKLTVKRAY